MPLETAKEYGLNKHAMSLPPLAKKKSELIFYGGVITVTEQLLQISLAQMPFRELSTNIRSTS